MSTKFAYRIETKKIKEADFPYDSQAAFSQPEVVAEFCRTLEDSDIEKMLVLYLNAKNKLICMHVTTGTVDRQVIYPREIIKLALLTSAAGIVLVHNHPSGEPSPSPEDINLTLNIKGCADMFDIRLLDHIVIGADWKFVSLQRAGLIK